jgi:hypothetical protein
MSTSRQQAIQRKQQLLFVLQLKALILNTHFQTFTTFSFSLRIILTRTQLTWGLIHTQTIKKNDNINI